MHPNCSHNVTSPHLKENRPGFISHSAKIERRGKVFEIILILFQIISVLRSEFLPPSHKQEEPCRASAGMKKEMPPPLFLHPSSPSRRLQLHDSRHTVSYIHFVVLKGYWFFFFFLFLFETSFAITSPVGLMLERTWRAAGGNSAVWSTGVGANPVQPWGSSSK